MTDLRELLAARPGKTSLAAIGPRSTPGLPDDQAIRGNAKQWSKNQVAAIGQELASYQERLFASAERDASRRRILLVLQAMDCGGKDGTVRSVSREMSPAGMNVVSFGPPTEEERRHDFLWRIRRRLPRPGQLGVFDRSHYEDVVTVRVQKLAEPRTWKRRYDAINRFENELAANGTHIIKCFLHISEAEQRSRLLRRLDRPDKHWKFDPSDLAARELWDQYTVAYQDALERCSSDLAPWYVIPADRKWYRNWAIGELLLDQLETLALRWPEPAFDIDEMRRRLLAMP
jgi:PPK2 family polyphosphate:nucleotide phosphotransferase